MKKMLSLSLVLLLTTAVIGPAQAALEQQPAEAFRNPGPIGIGNALLPALVDIPINQSIDLIDCLGGDLRASFDGTVSLVDPGYAVFFDGDGYVPLVVEGGAADLEIDGELSLIADDCLWGLLDGSWNFWDPEATVEQAYIGFIAIPFLNTDTGEIVLQTRYDSQLLIAGLELLPDLLGLEEIVEPMIVGWINTELTKLLDDGNLATLGDGGLVHDLLEEVVAAFYPACGCITVTSGTPDAGHLLVNMAFYLVPVGLILGLRRRMKG